MQDKAKQKKRKKYQKKHNKKQWDKKKKSYSLKTFVKWCLTEPKVLKRVRQAVVILNPVFIIFFIELMNDALLKMNPFVWLFATILMLALEMLFYAIFGNMSIAILVLDCILYPGRSCKPDPYECTWNTIFTGRSSCTWYSNRSSKYV